MRKLIASTLAAALIVLSPGPMGLRAMASVVNGTAARGVQTGPTAASAPAAAGSSSLSVPQALSAPSVSGSNLPALAPTFTNAPQALAANVRATVPRTMPAASLIVPAALQSATPRRAPGNAAARTAPLRPESPRETARAAVAEIAKSAAPDIAAAGARETGGNSLYAAGADLQAVLSGAFGSSRRTNETLAPKSSRFDSIKGRANAAAALRRFTPDAAAARGAQAVPSAVNAADAPAGARSAWG